MITPSQRLFRPGAPQPSRVRTGQPSGRAPAQERHVVQGGGALMLASMGV